MIMDTAIFIGKFLGITLAIWFLFYKKRDMPNLQKWGLSLGFSLLFLLAMFGLVSLIGLEALISKNIDEKPQSGLNTELHKQKTDSMTWKDVTKSDVFLELSSEEREKVANHYPNSCLFRGGWEVGSEKICTTEEIWRFVSHRELTGQVAEARRELGMIAVKGAYKIDWYNEIEKKLQVSYTLYFQDDNELEIARYNPGSGFEFVILPENSKEISGTFEIKVDNLEAANSIRSMSVGASFEEVLNK